MNAEDIYAKFNRSNMDVDKYQLWFFDDYDSQAALFTHFFCFSAFIDH